MSRDRSSGRGKLEAGVDGEASDTSPAGGLAAGGPLWGGSGVVEPNKGGPDVGTPGGTSVCAAASLLFVPGLAELEAVRTGPARVKGDEMLVMSRLWAAGVGDESEVAVLVSGGGFCCGRAEPPPFCPESPPYDEGDVITTDDWDPESDTDTVVYPYGSTVTDEDVVPDESLETVDAVTEAPFIVTLDTSCDTSPDHR